SLVALVGQVGEWFVSAVSFLTWGIDCCEQPTVIVLARQPLDDAIVIARKRGNFGGEKCIYIFAPAMSGFLYHAVRLLREVFRGDVRFGLGQLSHPKSFI